MSPDAGVGETLLFLSKQCLAIDGICSKALPKDYSWDMGQYLSTCALYLGCRTGAEDLHTAQQEAFLHETGSSL